MSIREKEEKNIERLPIGEILIKGGFLTHEQLEAALQKQNTQAEEKKKLGEILIQNGIIKEEDLLDSLSMQVDMTFLPMMKYHQSVSSLGTEKTSHNLQQYIDTMAFFIEVGILISQNQDTDTLVKLIAKKAPDIMDAESSGIFLLDQDEKELRSLVTLDPNSNTIHFDKTLGIAGQVLQTGKLLNVKDACQSPCLNTQIDKATGYSTSSMGTDFKSVPILPGYSTKSVLCTPLINTSGKAFGVFQVINKKQGDFTEEDEILIQIMASQISIAFENINTWNTLKSVKESLLKENVNLRRETKKAYGFSELIGVDDRLISVIETASQAAGFDIPVTIEGESGTGKELLAKSIHYNSSRAEAPFICINCSAIPENLLESELFGYEKGAFTGAQSSKVGLFEEADQGTLFLDEIGDMNLRLQVKILRFLQSGEIQRIGSNKIKKLDVRIITATNRNLKNLIKEGDFREDLYYRISVINLRLPPLRERKGDIPLLVRHFLEKLGPSLNKKVKGLTPEAQRLLLIYHYQGNIRELENIIKRALIITEGPFIRGQDLPEHLQSQRMDQSGSAEGNSPSFTSPDVISKDYATYKEIKVKAKRELEENLDKQYIIDLLKENNGNVSRAARHANMNRSLLHQMILRYKLDTNQYRLSVKNC